MKKLFKDLKIKKELKKFQEFKKTFNFTQKEIIEKKMVLYFVMKFV